MYYQLDPQYIVCTIISFWSSRFLPSDLFTHIWKFIIFSSIILTSRNLLPSSYFDLHHSFLKVGYQNLYIYIYIYAKSNYSTLKDT